MLTSDKYTPLSDSNSCIPDNDENPTKTNFAVLSIVDQTVDNLCPFYLDGGKYENGINLINSNTISFNKNGLYSVQFVVTVAANQPGPLAIGFLVNGGVFASGLVNSTNTGLEVTGIGFVEIKNAPTTATLVNYSNQKLLVDFTRLTIIKIS